MRKLRVAVIGVGHLGRFHAQKYAAHDEVELVGVADLDLERARQVAADCSTQAVRDHRDFLGEVEAVSIVVPAVEHFSIAQAFLLRGAHVLVEKPIATDLTDAQTLIDAADGRGLILQVGHLERFNPALQPLTDGLKDPLFVESHRLIPFNPRGTDVDVVLDLMIHDLDIILDLVDSPISGIDACGVPVLTEAYDIVNARIRFESGCTANVTASRVSNKRESRLRIFQQDAYFSADLGNRRLEVCRRSELGAGAPYPEIERELQDFSEQDLLKREIDAFLVSVRHGTPAAVSGVEGRRALAAALQIRASLRMSGAGH